jgi:hypothetical protein
MNMDGHNRDLRHFAPRLRSKVGQHSPGGADVRFAANDQARPLFIDKNNSGCLSPLLAIGQGAQFRERCLKAVQEHTVR